MSTPFAENIKWLCCILGLGNFPNQILEKLALCTITAKLCLACLSSRRISARYSLNPTQHGIGPKSEWPSDAVELIQIRFFLSWKITSEVPVLPSICINILKWCITAENTVNRLLKYLYFSFQTSIKLPKRLWDQLVPSNSCPVVFPWVNFFEVEQRFFYCLF